MLRGARSNRIAAAAIRQIAALDVLINLAAIRNCVDGAGAPAFRHHVCSGIVDQTICRCIRPLLGARCAPGHHGYQRACNLISGQTSMGHWGQRGPCYVKPDSFHLTTAGLVADYDVMRHGVAEPG